MAELRPLEVIAGDAADPRVLERVLDGVRHVVFCAGGLLPAASERDPELDARLTLEPLAAVLDALGRRPGVALTYLSSGGTVYGEPPSSPTPEEHPTRPIGSYGVLRLACERMIERAREQGLRARVLRCATVYGEHQWPDRGQGAVVTFLRRVASGEPIFLFGDDDHVRDYLYAGDVARMVVALLDRTDGPAVLNVGSGRGTSLPELVALVEAQVGRAARVVRRPARPFDVRRIVLDVSRLRELVAFEPTPLETGIERTHTWLETSAAAVEQAV
jgi:UDP-glucose 4-epimerase